MKRFTNETRRGDGSKAAALGSLVLVFFCLGGCAVSENRQAAGREPIVGGPCEGCEAVFQGLPVDAAAVARIAPLDEPGAPLRIEGKVTRRDGSLAAGTIVYAYHTNAEGIYPVDEHLRGTEAFRHGRLRGWAKTGVDGRYRFDTVRPGGYPGSGEPQHVHMHVLEPGRCTYYIDDVLFADDPRLTAERRERLVQGRGGPGVATPGRDADGVWLVERDIVLGMSIPDYPAP